MLPTPSGERLQCLLFAIHLHTLHIEHSVLLGVFTLLTVVNARLQRHLPDVRYFVLYNLLALLGSVAVTLREQIPNVLSITIGDRFGHVAGDHALQAVSRCLKRELRTADLLARSGGDEFVLLLPRTPGLEAAQIAECLRDCLQNLDLGLRDPLAEITGSFGVA